MKIVIYSRVAHKVSAEEFSAMIEIVTNAGFDYALNRDAARKLYGAEQTVIPEEALYDEITPSLATDSIRAPYIRLHIYFGIIIFNASSSPGS